MLYALFVLGCASVQRKFLYFPSHHHRTNELELWLEGKAVIGYARAVPSPHAVWLMLHGNAGQAADRAYALPRFSDGDSVYVLEYPGYGSRSGKPSRKSFNQAAVEAYASLRQRFPTTPICVIGESIGSGPASFLASAEPPPDKIVLVVPFDQLADVAADKMPLLPVRLILRDKWDNIEALAHYTGPLEIYGAASDQVIPIDHAANLAKSCPTARYQVVPGGHNEWSRQTAIAIRFP